MKGMIHSANQLTPVLSQQKPDGVYAQIIWRMVTASAIRQSTSVEKCLHG